MKEKLNLMKLSKDEMKAVEGAQAPSVCACGCFCQYAGSGGSSPIDNSGANCDQDLH